MKQRNTILILFIQVLVSLSCKDISKDDIQGNWMVYLDGYEEPIFREINFTGENVELIDDKGFKEVGQYDIKNGKIKIELDRDNLVIETEIQDLQVDTLSVFDSLTYHRNRPVQYSNFEEYRLIGIPTNKFLSEEKGLFYVIHFYKSNQEIQSRCGDKKIDFEEIHLFLSGGHSVPEVLVFIGEGINLRDLQNLYHVLALSHRLRVWLGTKREGVSDTHILRDEVEIWWDDLESRLENSKVPQPPPPPPPIDFISKEDYLANGGKEISISSKEDFQKIDNLTATGKYVVSINSNLRIEDYLEIKRKLGEKKKLNRQIITEVY